MLNVEIIGVGMGNKAAVQNPQTLAIPNAEEASFIVAQVAVKNYRTGERPESVTISTSIEQYEIFSPTSSGITFHYEVILQATDQITATVKGDGDKRKSPRALIAYIFRDYRHNVDRYAYSGRLVDTFIFGDTHVENFSIPAADHARDVNVTFVLSDVQEDLRTAVLQASAGDIIHQVTISQPNYGDELLIYTITLPDVPGDVDSIVASVTSSPENGDSLYWSGANISVICQ